MNCSARSRVRGTLDVYAAFIRDLDASDTSSSTNDPDWELVNEGETEPDNESIAHTQVSVKFLIDFGNEHFQFEKRFFILKTYFDLLVHFRKQTNVKISSCQMESVQLI